MNRPKRGSTLARRPFLGPQNKRGSRPAALTEDQIKAALEATGGVLCQAADKLNVSTDTLRGRVRRSADLEAFRESIRQETLDLSESVMLSALRNESDEKRRLAAARFFVSSLAGSGFGDSKLERFRSVPPEELARVLEEVATKIREAEAGREWRRASERQAAR